MFQISMTTLICVYLAILSVTLMAIWLGVVAYRTRRERNSRKGISICRICGLAFRPPGDQLLFKCPQCESLNEREKLREI
jgi:predicted RNA-binding Zn-ribbon protein involved in translation (DUF1610 family)